MIDLTPLDVRNKKDDLPRAVRGYDRRAVDHFLDLVSERMETLVREKITLTDRIERLESELVQYRERDQALTDALLTAQGLKEEVRRQAAKEAELTRRQAKLDAAQMRSTAAEFRAREEDALRRLQARRLQLVRGFRTFLERELAELQVLEATFELEPTASYDRSVEVRPPTPAGPDAVETATVVPVPADTAVDSLDTSPRPPAEASESEPSEGSGTGAEDDEERVPASGAPLEAIADADEDPQLPRPDAGGPVDPAAEDER